MVDLAEIQAAYYIVAATGVLIAAVFYILNMRETARNRRASLTTSLMQSMTNEEAYKRILELIQLPWSDVDDFLSKYDSKVNPENFAKRMTVWQTFEIIGHQHRTGVINIETVYSVCGESLMVIWARYKPIIEYYRGTDFSGDFLANFEYIAKVVTKMKLERDPGYLSRTFIGTETLKQVLAA